MPLTEEQKAAIQVLSGVAAEDAEEFRTELQAANNAIVHHIFRRGFNEAETRWKPRAEAAEAKVQEAEEKVAEIEARLNEERGKQPDIDKLNRDWQAKLDAAKAETEAERQLRIKERDARKLSDLCAHLTGLDPEYARWKASEHVSRLNIRDDGTTELFEKGSRVPIQVPEGKTPYQVLAEEILEAAPAALKLSKADHGGGTGGGGTGGKPSNPIEAAIEANRARAKAPNALRPAQNQ